MRLVYEHKYGSQWSPISPIAQKFGCTPETIRKCVRRAETDAGRREDLTKSDDERLKQLQRENR